MLRVLAIMVTASSALAAPPDDAVGLRHIYTYRQAEKARRVARDECRPLVVHFVPESETGSRQLQSFYARPGGVTPDQLAGVVIVVVPTQRFTGFARQLGIGGPGGYRTISPYDLSPLDEQSTPTCRSGFV